MKILAAKNFSYLGGARLIQFVVPLVIYPILVERIGLNLFGLIVFWTSIAAFLSKVATLNIEIYAARKIKEALKDSSGIILPFMTPMVLKAIAATVMLLPWITTSFVFSSNRTELLAIFFCFHPILNVTLIPMHYVLGVGKFDAHFFCSLAEKFIILLGCYFFVLDQSDFWIVPLVYFISTIGAAAVYLFWTSKFYFAFKLYDALLDLKNYTSVAFMSTAGKLSQLHTNAAKVIVGIFFDYSVVAVYDLVEKIINILKVPVSIVGQINFSSVRSSSDLNFIFIFHEMVITAASIALVYFWGDFILSYFLKEANEDWIWQLLAIQSLVLVGTFLVVSFGTNYVTLYALPNSYSKIMLLSNSISLILLVLWVLRFSDNVNAFSFWVAASEIIFGVLCFFKVRFLLARLRFKNI